MAENLLDAVYGSLIGGAVGDALGAPVETWYYDEIRREHGKVSELLPYTKAYCGYDTAGAVTDDTVLRHYLCLAIVRKGGRITPDDFAEVWLEKLNPDRLWENEKITLMKLKIGMDPWDAGKGNPPAGCASMAIAPIGIINAGDPAQAYQDAWNIAFVNQDGVNRDAAASIAAGQAAAFEPGATAESVIEAMTRHSSMLFRRAIDFTMDIASESGSFEEFTERFYAQMLDWTWPSRKFRKDHFFSGNSLEFVPVVMAVLRFFPDDINQAIIEGASFGRDCDTIASIAGNLLGPIHGASAIRADWIETVEKANEPFFEEMEGDRAANFLSMSERMVEALRKQARLACGKAERMAALVGERSEAMS